MHNRTTASLPCREKHAAMAALVVNVFQTGQKVGDTAEAEDAAEDEGPDAIGG